MYGVTCRFNGGNMNTFFSKLVWAMIALSFAYWASLAAMMFLVLDAIN